MQTHLLDVIPEICGEEGREQRGQHVGALVLIVHAEGVIQTALRHRANYQ